jgi:redox-sensing transcriptional repressor
MQKVDAATLKRLPQYHQILRQMAQRGRQYVSSDHLARLLKVDPSLVRKDLAGAATGVQKLGYHVPLTLEKIEDLLGMRNTKEAFLAGAGSLGRALMAYPGFAQYGLKITAAFDVDPAQVGEIVGGVQVLPVDRLEGLMRRMSIRIGIIAVPADAAQGVVDAMVRAGALAIWNFAPVTLQAPSNVIVRNENLAAGFALLSYELERSLNERSGIDDRSADDQPADD